MNAYEQVYEMLHYHFESLDRQGITTLKRVSSDYKKNYEESMAILDLHWMTNLLNNQMTEPMTPDQTKTVVRFIRLQSLLEYELRFMFYLYGMKDATALESILK